ncbi:hypothetical protein AURDEDRAFT_169929 [Auricularia subglabra TFB-10046 SS5]|uniref:Uncharacterized protein n=1 Tax=Auricularia subglabra (strain TFB-10046 / SS5) TaxID=717982 RepID=J0WWZ8_AURST|nr:hypothetical protein AURDEDRAFT_169929 [Auricularia subglabra TFB-10046 SS5]
MNVLRLASALITLAAAASAWLLPTEQLEKRICACCDYTCAGKYLPCGGEVGLMRDAA